MEYTETTTCTRCHRALWKQHGPTCSECLELIEIEKLTEVLQTEISKETKKSDENSDGLA